MPSIEETVAWYQRILGWEGHYDTFDEERHCTFGSIMLDDINEVAEGKAVFRGFNLIRYRSEEPYKNTCKNFRADIFVDDVDEAYRRVVEEGWAPDSAPEN